MELSPLLLPRGCSIGKSCWLLIGFTALLIVQHNGVSALPTPIQNNTDLRSIIDIPSIIETPRPARVMARKNAPKVHEQPQRLIGQLIDFDAKKRIISKRSEKTKEEYRKFTDLACRTTVDKDDTFFAWELDQFSRQLRKKLVPKRPRDVPVGPEERRTRALISPSADVESAIRSLCIPNYIPDDEKSVQEKVNNDHMENEVVNIAFANMYKYTEGYADKDTVKSMDRQPRRKSKRSLPDYENDEEFARKLAKALRR